MRLCKNEWNAMFSVTWSSHFFCYVMLIHIFGNVAHSHNEKLQVETDKYFDEAKKKWKYMKVM